MHWEVYYDDGTIHTEEELGSTKNVDRTKLSRFQLKEGEKVVFVAFFGDKTRKLVFRRRTLMTIKGTVKEVVYLVGWHKVVGNESVKSLCYIYSNGRVEFDNERNNLELMSSEL